MADSPALAELVNAAYAVESFFVDGHRTSPAEIAALVERGTFLVLESDHGELVAAVFIEPRDGGLYLGMLSVAPHAQGQGLGRRLVNIVEALAEATGYASVDLRIVNVREELGRWYRSLGYEEVATTPFDHRPTKQPCHFVEMRKRLRPAAAAA